jgi:hypothetical protein
LQVKSIEILINFIVLAEVLKEIGKTLISLEEDRMMYNA